MPLFKRSSKSKENDSKSSDQDKRSQKDKELDEQFEKVLVFSSVLFSDSSSSVERPDVQRSSTETHAGDTYLRTETPTA